MGNTFMTVVGTGMYQKCTYGMNDLEFESKFVQEAVLRILKQQGEKIDKIICLATKEAEDCNWESFQRVIKGMKNREFKNVEVPDEVKEFLNSQGKWEDKIRTDRGLKERFHEIYPEAEIQCVRIPLGSNEEELLDIFTAMYQAMETKDNLYIDVTHGFRSMPMLYIPVIKYAEALKDINVKAIYYGAFEAPGEKKPVFDLIVYKEIQDWAFGSKNFIKYGISADLQETARKRKGIKARKRDFSFNEAEKFVKLLEDFTKCIQTGRGNEISTDKSGQEKICIRRGYEDLMNFDLNKLTFPVLIPLLDKIRDSISEFAAKGNTATGLATVHWCRDKYMIQQGYTALEETIKSFVCDLYGFRDEVRKEIRDEVVGNAMNFCGSLFTECAKNNGKTNAIKWYEENQSGFFDRRGEWKNSSSVNEDEFKRVVESIPFDLVQIMADVKDKRNDINHFGMRNSASTPDKLKTIFEKQVNQFDELYKKYLGKTIA